MNLQTYQHTLSDLVKTADSASGMPAYWANLQTTGSIDRIRHIAAWWRKHQFSRYCPLTYRALSRLGQLDADVTAFYQRECISPYIEEAGPAFLQFVQARHNGLARSIGSFKRANIDVRTGRSTHREVFWPIEPLAVLTWLAVDVPTELRTTMGQYYTVHTPNGAAPFVVVAAPDKCLSLASPALICSVGFRPVNG